MGQLIGCETLVPHDASSRTPSVNHEQGLASDDFYAMKVVKKSELVKKNRVRGRLAP